MGLRARGMGVEHRSHWFNRRCGRVASPISLRPTVDGADCARRDLENDAECSERQARDGPYYPDRNITAETLTAYAQDCRAKLAQYAAGGLHNAILKGPL